MLCVTMEAFMKLKIIMLLLLAIPFVGSAGAQEPPKCKAGETTTIKFKIEGQPEVLGDGWAEVGSEATPCTVTMVRGKGRVPPGCTDGKTMEVTGSVHDAGFLLMNVTSARCY
jgi:hypothetical protein